MKKTKTRLVVEEEAPQEGLIKSHVEGLDEILGGGIPQGHVVLISGLPGTMKSTLAYHILYRNGIEEDRTSLYITLEQRKQSLLRQMASMGFDPDRVAGNLHILDVATLQKRAKDTAKGQWVDFLQRAVEFRKELNVVDLIVVDSLEALEVLAQFQDRRHDLFRLFDWFRSQKATSLLITETPPEPFLPGLLQGASNEADYLADGILHLRMHEVNEVDVQRRLRVVKMRAAHHKTGYYALVFDRGAFSVTRAMSGSFQ